MSDLRAILERESASVDLVPGGFDRLLQRRDRRQQNRRIVTAIIALVLAAVAIGSAIRVFRAAEPIPADEINRRNVSDLTVLATAPIGGEPGPMIASDGLVYVQTKGRNELVAFPGSCGARIGDCRPVWVADTSDINPTGGYHGVWAGGGLVYIATDRVYAFSASCGTGGSTCEPVWAGTVDGRPFDPSLGSGAVYVLSNRAKLYSFPTSCVEQGVICEPDWVSGKLPTRFFHPSVTESSVVVLQVGGDRYLAFPVDCGTDRATCEPSGRWRVPEGIRHFKPAISGDILFIATYTDTSEGNLWAYPTSCEESRGCEALWTAELEGGVIAPPPLVEGGKVFLASWDSGFVWAFPTGCPDPHCEPLWTASDLWTVTGRLGGIPGPMSVVNDLLFASGGGRVYAFPTECGTGNAKCEPVWTWGSGAEQGADIEVRSIATTDDRVFAVASDGTLYVLGLEADQR